MVGGLLRGQAGDGRQDPEGVAGQHEDVVRVDPHPGADDVAQMGDGIGGPGVFRQAGVIQVQAAGGQVDADVFQDGAELPGAFVDLRLGLGAQANRPWRSSPPRN